MMDYIDYRIDGKFWEFHWNNPKVFQLIHEFISDAINQGATYISMDDICHRIKSIYHEQKIDFNGPPGNDRLSNDFTSRYSRYYAVVHPYRKHFLKFKNLNTYSLLKHALKAGELPDDNRIRRVIILSKSQRDKSKALKRTDRDNGDKPSRKVSPAKGHKVASPQSPDRVRFQKLVRRSQRPDKVGDPVP